MKRTLKISGWLLGIVLFYLLVVMVHGELTDYRPEAVIELERNDTAPPLKDSTFSFLIWNIGYCGLGAETDFFYHGSGFFLSGDNLVRPSENLVDKYRQGMLDFLAKEKADFLLLQEVDYQSKRSYFVNQHDLIADRLPNFYHHQALNLKVRRNPAPVLEPWNAYGACESGLSTFSQFQPSVATRYQLPGQFSWPKRAFLLDRCLAVSRYPLANQRDLVVVNIHNSAYDKDGAIKSQQLTFLKALLLEEYEKGNYVVAGGDWNQCPPFFRPNTFMPSASKTPLKFNIPADYLPEDWQWVYDPTVPTIRSNADPFVRGKTFVSLIDFFLVSPNVKAIKVQGYDLQFAFSDHQPVRLEVELQ